MPITFPCDHCGKSLTARDESAGRLVTCSGCGRQLRVPTFIPAAQPKATTGRLSSRDKAWIIAACSVGGVSLAVPCLIFLLALLGVWPADRAVEQAPAPPVAVGVPGLVDGPAVKPVVVEPVAPEPVPPAEVPAPAPPAIPRVTRPDDEPAPLTRGYPELRERIVALRERLLAARSKDWLRDDGNLENLKKWGEFARRFQRDHDQLANEIEKLPLSDRIRFADTLNYVQMMFMETALPKSGDYAKVETLYHESLETLDNLPTLKVSRPTSTPKRPGPSEAAASNLLRTAKKAQADGREVRARALLVAVVRDYAGTEAAKEARDLLRKMGPLKP